MIAFVTGCAGFIGSHLTERLLAEGHEVVGFDNFSTGQRRFLDEVIGHPRFRLVEGDLLDLERLRSVLREADTVFHLAANADVRHGPEHPERDLQQNTVATYHVLEAMRTSSVKRIAFASTGSVYGDARIIPTPEEAPFPIQTSLYGASKLAGEGLISAYCEAFGFRGWIFRLVSILGERYSHGHVFDFYRQLKADPTHLAVLGNGKQRKSYLHVQDCIEAMLLAVERAEARVSIFNLGADSSCEVNESIAWICAALRAAPRISYTGGERGWIGDAPLILLDTSRIRSLGFRARLSIREGICRTVEYLKSNPWLLEARS
jgi:UDP-glucose 4-epimerase